MPNGSDKVFIIRLSEKRAKQYSKKRVFEKLVLGELSPENEVMGEDGLWKPLGQTPGFRKFCSNLKILPLKPSADSSTDQGRVNLGKIIQNSAESPKDSVWDGFQLDEQDETLTGRDIFPSSASSGEILVPHFSPAPPKESAVRSASVIPSQKVGRTGPVKPKSPNGNQDGPKPPPGNLITALLPPAEPGENSKGYGVLEERESKVSRQIRKKVVASYAPIPLKNNGVWIERGIKLVFLAALLAVVYFAGPVLMEKANKYWDKASDPKPAPKGNLPPSGTDLPTIPPKILPGTPPIRK